MTDTTRLTELLERIRLGTAGELEFREIKTLIGDDPDGETIAQIHAYHSAGDDPAATEYDYPYWQEVLTEILAVDKEVTVPEPRRLFLRPNWWWAAAAVMILLGGMLIWQRRPGVTPTVPAIAVRQDRPPGGNKAMLTLAGGQTIVLDSAANGLVARQGDSRVQKTTNGQLSYQPGTAPPGVGGQVLYNTLATPRGGQYQLVLPDGTKVWLNAQSSITYPTSFTGKERAVTVTGEAYFEVIHNPGQPFRVTVGEETVEVLGTSFNVNSYPDEPAVEVTLLTGVVAVRAGRQEQQLKPGDQAAAAGGEVSITKQVDIGLITAWKDGLFSFDQTDLATVLRQFARWYDVDVQFEGRIPDRKFFGIMKRSSSLATVLQALRANDVKFTIEGKILKVQ